MEWVVALLAGLLIGGGGLYLYLKTIATKAILSAQEDARNIVESAQREAETLKKEMQVNCQEEIFQQRQQLEAEFEERKARLVEAEKALDQREVEVDRNAEMVAQKEKEVSQFEKQLAQKEEYLRSKTAELNNLMTEEIRKLEEISGWTREQAKEVLLADLRKEAEEEAARISESTLERARSEAQRKAREIVVQAIQQVAAEQSVEATVSVITLPNDDMKGRIIGREGRNIRAFEMITGVDVIIDDTPEVVVLSSYNSFRREVARLALEKLINDGRIHPARIEEVVAKTADELKESLQEIGEQALLDLGVHGVAPEVAEVLGMLKYRTSYGQNVLNHCLEVANICGIMATELGLDVRLARRAGVLHDIGKGLDFHKDQDHAAAGAEFLQKFNENPIVINATRAHHNEREATSPITLLVAAADKVSGSRPGARRESLESFIRRMEQLEQITYQFEGVSQAYAIQAGREVRVIIETEKVDDSQARDLARKIAREIQMKVEFPGQIKVSVIREYRAYDYAT